MMKYDVISLHTAKPIDIVLTSSVAVLTECHRLACGRGPCWPFRVARVCESFYKIRLYMRDQTSWKTAAQRGIVVTAVAAVASLAPQFIWPEAPRAVVPQEAATSDEWRRG